MSVSASLHTSEDGTGVVSDGGGVGHLGDQSGNGLHALQPLFYARPLFAANGGAEGNRPELIFDGGNDQLVTDVITRTGPGTLVFVGKIASDLGIFAHHDTAAGGLNGDFLTAVGTGRYRGFARLTGSGTNLNDGDYHVVIFAVDPDAPTAARLYADGVLIWDNPDEFGTDSLTGPVYLGALADGIWNGAVRLHEARLYDVALSEAQALALCAELAAKWAIP